MIDLIERCIREGEVLRARELIHQAVKNGIDLRGRHINFAHYLIFSADWQTIDALLPAGTNALSSTGFLESLKGPKPVNAEGAPIPWLTYPAIDFLDAVVKNDWRVFEYGAGNSTLWWAERVNEVHSVEADADWYQAMDKLVPENVRLSLKQTDESYAKSIQTSPTGYYDAIVVDGGPRPKCIEAAVAHLKSDGVLVVDNSDISALAPIILQLDEQGFCRLDFWGLVPCYLYKNCTSVFFKNPNILRGLTQPSRHRSSVGRSCVQIGESVAHGR